MANNKVMDWIKANDWICTGVGRDPRQIRVCRRDEYPLLVQGGAALVARSASIASVEITVTIPDDVTDEEFQEFVDSD